MKKLLLAFLLPLILCASAHGTTRTAASCTLAAVQTTVNLSVDGDTVLVPGSTCNTSGTAADWSAGTLTINVALTLNGQGANINMGTSGSPAIQLNADAAGNAFITGFVTTGQRPAGSCAINITTSSSPLTMTYRLHHNVATGGGGTWSCHNGLGPGLIDHNTITWGSGEIIHDLGISTPNSNGGWLDDVTPGGPNMLFMEDNTFTNTSTTTVNGPTTNYYGMRVVFRHNNVNLGTIDGHAGNTGGQTGTRWMEIYQNTYSYNGTDTGCWAHVSDMRGGSGVVWGNTMTGGGPQCSNQPGIFTGPYVPSSDPSSGTWPLPWQVGRGFQTSGATTSQTYSPAYSWGNTGFGFSPQLNAQGNGNGNFVVVGTGPNACGTFHPGGVCDGIVTSGPTGLLRCQSAADVVAGCPVTYNYVPFTYPHPLITGGTAPIVNCGVTNFGNQNLNTSASLTATCTNSGSAIETYSSISLSPSVFVNANTGLAGQCPASGTIAISASCTVKVTFTPTVAQVYSGILTVTGTVTGSGSLSGTGTNAISVPSTPTGLTTTVNGANVTLNWTPSTGTPTGYHCKASTVSGGPYSRLVAAPVGPPCVDSGLSNGTYFYVVDAFNSAGNSLNSTQASAVVSTLCSLNLNPPALNYGSLSLGTSVTLSSTVTNVGTASCGSVSVANPSGPNGADFSQTNNCTSLAVNATCAVNVTFTPSVTTLESAAVVITGDPSGPDTIILSGTGTPVVVLSPPVITLANTYTTKTSATAVLTYANQSPVSITVSSIVFSGGDAAVFSETDNCVGTVTSGSSCTINITFTPTSNGTKTTNLVITDSATGSPRTVVVTGSAKGHKILRIGAVI